jgi:hypothetical protein
MTIGSATTEAPVKAETDPEGNFMFPKVPAGAQVLVTITKQGFATVRTTATVPAAAGQIPLNDGNANLGITTLTELNGTVKFTLVTPSGRPAAGATAFMEVTPTGTTSTNAININMVSTVRLRAVADGQGVVTFSGVPAPSEMARLPSGTGTYHLWVEPVDLNNDGVLESGGLVTSYTAQQLLLWGTTQLVSLPQPWNQGNAGTFNTLRASNLATLLNAASRDPLRNMLRSGESIYVAFAHPVQPGSLLATVTDEFGREGFNLQATPNSTGDVYTLAMPGQLPIREGQEYNVILRAISAYDGSSFIRKGYFVSGDARTPRSTALPGFVTASFKDVSPANGQLDYNECVVVNFNQVIVPPEGGGAASAHAFFNAELGFSAGIGNDQGEYNAWSGFTLILGNPPQMQANCFEEEIVYPIDTATFTYTPRFYFWFRPPNSAVSIPVGTKVRLGFGHHQSTTGSVPYRTAWGVPLTENLEIDLVRQP